MPPMNRGQLQVVSDLQSQGSVQPGIDTGRSVNFGGAEALGDLSATFSQIGKRIGGLADAAASREGEAAGREAGLDPEFRTRQDGTIRGGAFDRAGLDIAETRLKTAAQEQFEQAYEKHKASPGKLGQALDAAATGLLQGAPDELRPRLTLQLGASRLSLMRTATREMQARVRAEQTAAQQADLALSARTLHQQSYALGLDDEAADVRAANLASYRQLLARRGPDGQPLIAPAVQQKLYRGAELETTTATLLGAMERLPTAEARASFLAQVEKDFAGSTGLAKVYDFSEFQSVRRQLEGGVRQALVVQRQQSAEIGTAVKHLETLAKDGMTARPADLAAIKAAVATSGSPELAARLADAEGLLDFQSHWARQNPERLDAWVRQERDRLTSETGATLRERERLQLGEQMLTRMREGLQRDPYAWAERSKVLPSIAPLDLGDPDAARPQAFENTTRLRVAQHAALEEHYGVTLPLLRPHEKRQMQNWAAKGPEAVKGMTAALVRGFGDAAPKVLAEIGKDAPELAALGAMLVEGGDDAAASDAAAGLALQRLPDYAKRRRLPDKRETQPVVSSTFGQSFMAIPAAQVAVEELAGAIYEARATRDNLSSFKRDVYAKALSQAAGEVEVEGKLYGGIGGHRTTFGWGGRQVIVPREIRQDRFDEVIDLVTDDDLSATGHDLRTGKGAPLKADDIKRRGTFVALGSGRYHVALGDPSVAPQWVADAQGRPAVVDLRALAPRLRRRAPQHFLGGE